MNKNWHKFTLIILALGLAALKAQASIPNRAQNIDLAITPVYPVKENIIDNKVIADYMPPLTPTNDEKAVVLEFRNGLGQKLLEHLFSGEYFKKTRVGSTTVGKITQEIQEVTRPTFSVSKQPTSLIRSINFNFRAFERRAIITSTGWLSSSLTYTMDDNFILAEISKPISASTTLSFVNRSPVGQINREGTVYITYVF
jgi:hypothetical protein